MISIVTFKWRKPGYKTVYTAQHVNTLYSMVARHYSSPFRFICITDDAEGIMPEVECFPLWDDFKSLRNPTFPAFGPNCYPRLPAFSKDFAQIAGERLVCLDLDALIVADPSPLWHRCEDFVIYEHGRGGHYNGSMWLMSAGCRSQVWDDFDPETSPQIASKAGARGTDQGWIWYRLGKGEAVWTAKDGVYSYRTDLAMGAKPLPADARIVFFWGWPKPWDKDAQRLSWVQEHYR